MFDVDESHLTRLVRSSVGRDGRASLTPQLRAWARPLAEMIGERFWIHDDEPARLATAHAGRLAFAREDRIYLGALPASLREHVLRHELVHLAQIRLARRTGRVDAIEHVEEEADRIAASDVATQVRRGADPDGCYGFWWVAIGVGVYILLRPNVANAPAPDSRLRQSVPLPQVVFESVALFVVPGGAIGLGGRLGLGFFGSAMLAGASGNVSLRAVEDVFNGASSPPLAYLFDASTGAIIGFVVPGGFRLVGRAGTWAFDRLATYGLTKADLAITQALAEAAAESPLNAAAAQKILGEQGLVGRVSSWWLNRRGLIVLYRGQGTPTSDILSPLARSSEGVAASKAMMERLRTIGGATDTEIASYTARFHDQPVHPYFAPPGLGYEPLGGVGIPTTRIPGIAADFGPEGVIYVLRVPHSTAIAPIPWQNLAVESELVIFHRVPPGSIVRVIPAHRVSPLTVNELGQLVPGASR